MPIKACKFKSCPGHPETPKAEKRNARVAELVDAHVSGACSERSAGSSPVPGTKEILQVVQNERKSKIFFLLYPKIGHNLVIFSKKV